MSGTMTIPEIPTLYGDATLGGQAGRAGQAVGRFTNPAMEGAVSGVPKALGGPPAAMGTGITADMLQKLLRLGAPLSFISTLLDSSPANAPGLSPETLHRNIAADQAAQRGDPRDESTRPGAQAGSGTEIKNFDNMGTYARAVQLAQLMGVPAFTFQGKLYRPGDTQAPVRPAPQMRPPGGMPQEAGPRQAPSMDRREPSLPVPASAAPAPAPAAAPQPDYSNLERGGGGSR